jgi:pyrrolidone-carboxylate peptidase
MKSNQPKLLVSGFGAFEEFDRNPSQDIAQIANGQT